MALVEMDFALGGGGTQEVYHDTAAQITSAGWNTGCKLSDISVFVAWADNYARMILARNNGGSLETLHTTNPDTTLTVNASGYLVLKCSNATVQGDSAEAYGYK